MFLCKRWMPRKFIRSVLTVETLASSKHGEIILKCKSMSQTKGKCDSLVLSRSELLMVWRCHGIIPRVHCYYFCLEPTVRKSTWMRTTYVTVMVIFSKVTF